MIRMMLGGTPIFLAFAFTAPLAAQQALKESDAFFKAGTIVDIVLDLDPKSLDALRREPRKYAKATLKVGGKTYQDVGVHVKGAAGSFRGIDDKPGLTLNMNKFGQSQRFHGMDKFHLANSVQDGSYIHELLSGEIFRAVGVPASRVTHASVTIAGRKRGFYYLKEGYDKFFLAQHFKNTEGNLYDGGFLRDIDQPLQLLATKKDVKDHADLKALLAAARDPNPKTRWPKLEKLLEMDKFLAYLCVESLTWDWDGYPMNRNNFRIYHDPSQDKITFIPSGMDQLFGDPNGSWLPGFQGVVARAVVETPEGRKRYLAKMQEVREKVYDPKQISKRLEELQARIQPALAKVDPGAAAGYPGQIQRIRDLVNQRCRSIDEQLKRELKK